MNDRAKPLFGDPIGDWHLWFAWRPVVCCDRRVAWLRFVFRRAIQKHQYLCGGADFWWQYAFPATREDEA